MQTTSAVRAALLQTRHAIEATNRQHFEAFMARLFGIVTDIAQQTELGDPCASLLVRVADAIDRWDATNDLAYAMEVIDLLCQIQEAS